MKKIGNALTWLFAVGCLLTLFAGALSAVGYLVALAVGGEWATELCAFIYKEFFPWVIRICSVCVLAGLLGMYLENTKALSLEK